jgi:hypothetical protein
VELIAIISASLKNCIAYGLASSKQTFTLAIILSSKESFCNVNTIFEIINWATFDKVNCFAYGQWLQVLFF